MKCIPITAATLILASLGTAVAASGYPLPVMAAPADADAAPDGEDGPFGAHDGGRGEPGPCGPGPRRGGPMGGPGFSFLRGIELSEAQQDRLFAILHAQAPQLREQAKAEDKAHEALRAMMEGERFDEAKAAAQARALGQAIAARELLRVRTAGQVRALLTPQQREQLDRARAERD